MKKKGRQITRVSRSHKLVSFLLTLVLLFTMFPTTAISASDLGPIIADDHATLVTPEQKYSYISGNSEELPASIQAGNPITDMPGTFLLSNKDNGRMILYTPVGNYAFPQILEYSSDPDGDAWIFQCLDENRYVIRSAWDSNFAFCGMGSTFMLSDSFHSNEGILDTYCWDLEYAVGGGVYIRNADSGYVLKCDGSSFSLIPEPSINHADHDRTVFYMVERSQYVMLTDFSLTNNHIAPGDTSSFNITCTPAGAVWKSGNHFSYSIVSHGTGAGNQFSVTKDGSVTAPVNGGTATLTMTQMHTGLTKSFTIKSGILPDGQYFFENVRTNRFMDIEGQSTANDAFLNQYSFHADNSQKWNLQILADGTYSIKSELTGKYMHVAGGYTYDGANIVQYQWTAASHSKWRITETSSGNYRVTPSSATTLALGVPVGQNSKGTRLAQIYYGNDSEYSDEWKIHKESSYVHVTLPVKIFYDSTIASQKTVQQMLDAYNEAALSFKEVYKIHFSVQSVEYKMELNCETDRNVCAMAPYVDAICNPTCGSFATCRDTHHRSAFKLLNQLASTDFYTCRLVGYKICDYRIFGPIETQKRHDEVFGIAYKSGKESIITTQGEEFIKTIRHELSHNLGTDDDLCSENNCVVSHDAPSNNSFCSVCDNTIRSFLLALD